MTRFDKGKAAMAAAPVILILGACSVVPIAAQTSIAPGYSCVLRAVEANGQTDITALLTAAKPTVGHYTLDIGQAGIGSTAMIQQGGPFEAASGAELVLGQVSLSAGAGLSGQFTVIADGTTVHCPITGPLTAR